MTRLRPVRTSDGRQLEASHVIAVPADEAWDLLVDTTRWPEWSPTIREVEATDRRIRAGTRGRVRVPGVWLPFRVTHVDQAERRWEWRVVGLPGPGHRVDDLGPDRCRVAFELPLGAAGYAPVCLEALESIAAVLEEPGHDSDDVEDERSEAGVDGNAGTDVDTNA
ncbi:Polyketide cyclase / dehydrase and lipid transport [Halobiforma haloterrestris]|uniref:Polyketide cyclase / dehydrase and lipid transport n=1 Tax=Natronobacterium haloterrestre TaxID=148448 RepID=A0A1I1G5I2_NATHA|nr:SRPBCC family protein [Halobiforma haloterrestris]SFC06556.1 Polyketide cyclase / dehydrase and lipid transport [Halobiforma haloterrestris]